MLFDTTIRNVQNISDDPEHPWYINNQDINDTLEAEIAKDLTPERLKQIVYRSYEEKRDQHLRILEEQIFNNLSPRLKVRWLNLKLEDLLNQERAVKTNPEYNEASQLLVIESIENERKTLEKQLRSAKFQANPPTEGYIGIDEVMIAKQVPISDFIQFKHKKAKCLWHDDHNPSMYYYQKTNTVKCFACQANEDVIGVVMKVFGLSFIDAVKKLLP